MKFVINVIANSMVNIRNELNLMVQHTGLSKNNYVLEPTREKNVRVRPSFDVTEGIC